MPQKRHAPDRFSWSAAEHAPPAAPPLGKDVRETHAQWKARLTDEQAADHAAWQAEHRWRPRQLRHNAGTLIRKQFGSEVAQLTLGHACLATIAAR